MYKAQKIQGVWFPFIIVLIILKQTVRLQQNSILILFQSFFKVNHTLLDNFSLSIVFTDSPNNDEAGHAQCFLA